ncbi:hypothetical protein O6H91_08G081000 [Diphasiastrum complanatum]|uniref:Uncharacterized protein n=1 Tax=Diphasiastrum complanatum TaxID=34168 RepID=A0ACC2D094_DIPCM|nr:hypothetical protein O6H91_08G081000 [Diphasiastrum complanatum]
MPADSFLLPGTGDAFSTAFCIRFGLLHFVFDCFQRLILGRESDVSCCLPRFSVHATGLHLTVCFTGGGTAFSLSRLDLLKNGAIFLNRIMHACQNLRAGKAADGGEILGPVFASLSVSMQNKEQ